VTIFETTSLYGNTKSNSQYDGLEPYVKFKGFTESELQMFPTDNIFREIRDKVRSKYGNPEWGNMLIQPYKIDKNGKRVVSTSPKLREWNIVLNIIQEHLNSIDPKLKKEFKTFLNTKSKTNQQKRYYMSNFGFTNVKDYVLNGQELERPNPSKYDLESLINYWKNKSFKRWSKLTNEGRIKTDIEVYTIQTLTDGINFKTIR
jgi:hypothetical protein